MQMHLTQTFQIGKLNLAELLINFNADLNAQDHQNCTALHRSIENGLSKY